jgi:hypothetical protein
MKIGHPGVEISEYEASEDANFVTGYIQPACENPRWILWFTNRGEAIFHCSRDESGAVLDEAIKVSPSLNAEVKPRRYIVPKKLVAKEK